MIPRKLLAPAALFLACFVSAAQSPVDLDPGEVARRVSDAHLQNLEKLQSYTWVTTADIKKGKVEGQTTTTVRFLEGELSREVTEEIWPETSDSASGIRKQDKIDKARTYTRRLLTFLDAYAPTTSGPLHDLIAGGTIAPGGSEAAIRIAASGAVVPDDRLTLWIDPGDWELRQAHVFTTYRKAAVMMEIDFGRLPDGVVYPTEKLIHVPSRGTVITIRNRQLEPAP